MGLFKQLLGICGTQSPADAGCWACTDNKVEVDLERASELSHPGGAIRLEGSPLPCRVLLLHGNDGKFHAFPNRCTHIGHRRLDPLSGGNAIRCCSIGQSVFSYDGQRLSGFAREALKPFRVELDGRKIIVFLE